MIGPETPDLGSRSPADCASCPSAWGHRYPLHPELLAGLPPGFIRRVAPIGTSSSEGKGEVDEARRNILKLALVGGVLALGAAGGASALRFLAPPQAGAATFPQLQLHYDDGSPILVSQYRHDPTETDLILFNYPLTNEPNMLLNLGTAAPNGVGPNQNLVAFSAICQHLGCVPPYISYYPPGACGSYNGGQAIIHCICHGSTFDPRLPAAGGGAAIVSGPTELPLPQVLLHWDQGTDFLYAVGVIGPPIRGHSDTLLGGTPVTSPLSTDPPQAPTQQCPT